MNWIERLYYLQEIGKKDLYSQNGEGLYLEYIFESIDRHGGEEALDIGGGDGFYLSNTRHLVNLNWEVVILDPVYNGDLVKIDNVIGLVRFHTIDLISIDIDGNDYWILDKVLRHYKPFVIIAEFNSSYIDSRTIKYDPDFVWDGDSYYGFSFEAGKKLAEANGYTVIFQVADMNMIMVRNDLIKGLHVPPVAFKQSTFFKMSERTDWVFI